ncbi:MAG: hypothetical protein M1822_001051 [Bathelium mastoideum]|nr:MAG: hypothetical protein M1822_001051 [Bathelium mastoideum]
MTPPRRYESQDVDISPLSRVLHFDFAGREAPNRFLKGSMEERLCTWRPDNQDQSGIPNAAMFKVYQQWSEGAIGNILTGSIIFEHDQVTQRGDPVIPIGAPFSGERFDAFATLARIGKSNGSLMIGQVNHPGRQIDQSIQPNPISASDVQQAGFAGQVFAKPRAASRQDISRVVEGFAHSAAYLENAGYDGIELHAAHGYLLAQFLSSATNLRTDEYGGNLTNRTRLVLEIAQAIRHRTSPSFILGIKLSSVDFQNDFESGEAKQLCALLEQSSFDFVELSGGALEHFEHKRESTRKREAFFLDFAETIAPLLERTKIYITGGFKTAGAMVQALDKVDGVGLARPLCQEPQLCRSILRGDVKGAIKQDPDEDNYGLTNVVAGTQIRRISQGLEPLDMSREYDEPSFMREMNAWLSRLTSDAKLYGFFIFTPT